MNDKLESYDQIVQIAPDVYTLDGDWEETVFRRRMTIVRMSNGGLVIHNSIRLRDEDYSKVDALGKVEVIVVPNFFHGSDAHYFKHRYPSARLFVPRSLNEKISKKVGVSGVLPDWDSALKVEIDCLQVDGLRMLEESVFLHRASKTLILTDLVFNLQQELKGFMKIFCKWNKVYRRFGPSRIFKYMFVKNPEQVKTSVSRILEWDFDRVVMNHGMIKQSGAKEALVTGFKEMGLL